MFAAVCVFAVRIREGKVCRKQFRNIIHKGILCGKIEENGKLWKSSLFRGKPRGNLEGEVWIKKFFLKKRLLFVTKTLQTYIPFGFR